MVDSSIGERIKYVRGTLSRPKFAKRIGVSLTTVQNYETSNTLPKLEVLRKISTEFGINNDWLITGVGNPYCGENSEKPPKYPGSVEKNTSWILTDIIRKHNLTDSKLAQIIGYDENHIVDFRKMIREPRGSIFDKLRDKFNVNPLWIFGMNDEPYFASEDFCTDSIAWSGYEMSYADSLIEEITEEISVDLTEREKNVIRKIILENITDKLKNRVRDFVLMAKKLREEDEESRLTLSSIDKFKS